MGYVVDNWFLIIVAIIFVANLVYGLIRFGEMPTEEKVAKIKGWLLQAVMMAEKEYGSGTGSLKLSVVYARFCEQLPWLAQIITFKAFSEYVDEALERMRLILASNRNIAAVVEGEESVGDGDADCV